MRRSLLETEMMYILSLKEYTDDNIEKLLDFAKEYNGVEESYTKIDSLLEEADQIITTSISENEIKTYMRLFLTYLRERTF